MNPVEEFNAYRARMNEKILAEDNLAIKRFYSLDSQTYAQGALDVRTKEMLGLVSSLVLRCDDCVKYHLEKCYEEKLTKKEIMEIFQVGLMVGGSIVIPHMRRGYEFWEALEKQAR
jgi:AhpD family alkylhydroperoxidase